MEVIEIYKTYDNGEHMYRGWEPIDPATERFTGRCKLYSDGSKEYEVERDYESGFWTKKKRKLVEWYREDQIRRYTIEQKSR